MNFAILFFGSPDRPPCVGQQAARLFVHIDFTGHSAKRVAQAITGANNKNFSNGPRLDQRLDHTTHENFSA